MSISVVMSTYNGKSFIKKQLDSILNQTVIPDEVIICDDCSSDDTVGIISNYITVNNLNTWTLSVNKKNLGYKANFYQGILKSKGDYVFFSDQDDVWLPNKIELMMQTFNEHPEIWTINCGVCLINEFDNPIKEKIEKNWANCNFLYTEKKLPRLSFYASDFILRHNVGPGCAMAIDRRTADTFIKTYNNELPHDWHMNLIAAINGGCSFLNIPLIKYRLHGNNTIGANTNIFDGIRKKTRDFRVKDYQSRLASYYKICNQFDILNLNTDLESIALIKGMIDFYQSPSIFSLIKLRKMKGYKELSKRKVQLWEIAVALHLDVLIKKVLTKKNRK